MLLALAVSVAGGTCMVDWPSPDGHDAHEGEDGPDEHDSHLHDDASDAATGESPIGGPPPIQWPSGPPTAVGSTEPASTRAPGRSAQSPSTGSDSPLGPPPSTQSPPPPPSPAGPTPDAAGSTAGPTPDAAGSTASDDATTPPPLPLPSGRYHGPLDEVPRPGDPADRAAIALFRGLWIVATTLAVLVGGAWVWSQFFTPSGESNLVIIPAPSPEPFGLPAERATVSADGTMSGDGIFQVGEDIPAGSYRSDHDVSITSCWWARLSGPTDVDDNYIAGGQGPAIVTVLPDDVAFSSTGCGSWQPLEDTFPDEPATTFGPGVHQVGDHVQPGDYWALSPMDRCSWTRLTGYADHHQDAVGWQYSGRIATIMPDDVGFASHRCGDWIPLSEAPVPSSPAATIGDGTHRVGIDVEPGTYVSDQSPSSCFWARLAGYTGVPDDTLADGYGPSIVTIPDSDTAFESDGCGDWTPVDDDAPATPATSFDDGTHRVGIDIQPGTWLLDAAGESCYWERVRDFLGTFDSIIDNGSSREGERTTVEVLPGDVGFRTARCGTWTLQ